MRGGLLTYRFASRRLVLLAPAIGLVIAGLAIAFSQAADKPVDQVLFSGQDALPGLVAQGGTWSLWALALLIACKGVAYSLSLGAAGGVMASHLPGFPLTAAVAVGMGAAVVAVLRLPLSAVVLATLLTAHAGTGDEPLIIVGVVVSYIVTLVLTTPAAEDAS
jgi:MFS family permease